MGVETVLMVAGTAFSAYSAIQQGERQAEWADYQAKQAEADAAAERSAAVIQAEKIRKLARAQAGESTAALAGSGVDVGEGTAVNINKDIYANAEEDAMLMILGGIDRANRREAEADALRLKGNQAQQAGYLNATTSLLGSAALGSTVPRGWITSFRPTGRPTGGTVPGYSSSDLGSGLRIG